MAFRVALTFDAEHGDRPAEAGNDERLLDALAAFVQGLSRSADPLDVHGDYAGIGWPV